MLARDYFAQVLANGRDMERLRYRLMEAESALDGIGGSSGAPVVSGSGSDPSWRIHGRIEAMDAAVHRYRDGFERCVAARDEAMGVIDRVRPDNAVAGSMYRAALQYRYVEDMTLAECSELMHCRADSVGRYVRFAFEWIDSSGILAAM